jgi:CDP-diglyceride synthetase
MKTENKQLINMSYIKDLSESHDSIKAISLNLILIPFWYVSIFMFNKEFYKASDSLIVISFCIVLSFLSSMLLAFFWNIIDIKNNIKVDFFSNMNTSIGVLTIWLSALIFITYSFGFLFKQYIYFYWFIVIYFSPIILIYILGFLFPDKKTDLKK